MTNKIRIKSSLWTQEFLSITKYYVFYFILGYTWLQQFCTFQEWIGQFSTNSECLVCFVFI